MIAVMITIVDNFRRLTLLGLVGTIPDLHPSSTSSLGYEAGSL